MAAVGGQSVLRPHGTDLAPNPDASAMRPFDNFHSVRDARRILRGSFLLSSLVSDRERAYRTH